MQNVPGNLNDWSRSLIFPFHRLRKRSQRWRDSFIVCNSIWSLYFEEIEVSPA